ncbi:MAG: murein biosynthesis integral membrane protein MurJ [Propionibacteriaceae bacterium]|nr:murein biosynthesis integral membrane protein MurJ [Propionibacteriaceae bacterium]
MSQVSSTKKLLSASAVMASGTLISRALGMLRVMLIAFILGNGTRQADILSIATMVPNALYILFAGGALNTVLVPQIVRAIKHDEDGGEAFTNRIMTAFMLIVGAVTVVALLCAPLITMLYSDSAWRQPALSDQYASMVALTYLTLPQIFFYGAFFLLSQILNARDKFGPMMWAPIANNVISICVLSTYFFVWGNHGDKSVAFTTPQILVLGIGSTLGIATQTLVLLPFLKRVGFKLRPRFDLKGTGLRHTFSLTKWTLGFVAVNQLALIIVDRLATTATATGAGAGVNVYSNAHLLWILPHSLVTTSLATAMLSNASRLAADGDRAGVAAEMTKTARLALIFLVPATAVFLSLSTPIGNILFGHGQGAADASWVGSTLVMFTVGLIPFTVQFLCLRTYYALEDTRTPFLLQIGIATVNAVGAILLVWLVADPTRVAPMLALSYSIAYFFGVFVSWAVLTRKLPDLDGRALLMHIIRLLIGAAPGALLAWLFQRWFRAWMAVPGEGTLAARVPVWADLVACVVGGLLVLGTTVLVGKALKVKELRRLTQLVRRGRGGAPTSPAASDAAAPARAASTTAAAELAVDDQGLAEITLTNLVLTTPARAVTDASVSAPSPAPEQASNEDSVELRRAEPDGAADGAAAVGGPSDTEPQAEPMLAVDPIGRAGDVLGVRYALLECQVLRTHSETWIAHDQVLDRDVIAHVMADEPGAQALLNAARRGAVATDSRFLRVLDVSRSDDDTRIGVYAICEHTEGNTLRSLLQAEPLSAKESAYVGHEVADALGTMHIQGLFHERIDPDHILVMPSGDVRIVGFGTAAVLEGADQERPWSQRESADVLALAAVLRACQTGHWSPSSDERADGYPLSRVWQGAFDGKFGTMDGLVDALPVVDATVQLEAKMGLANRVRVTPSINSAAAAVPGDDAPPPAPRDGAGVTAQQPATPLADPAVGDEAPSEAERSAPAAPVSLTKLRAAFMVAAMVVALVLLVWLSIAALRGANQEGATTSPSAAATSPTPDASASAGPIRIASVKDFDPEADNGNNEEFPEKAANVVDGKDSTTWTTMRYLNRPTMGGLKQGVGLVLDLGKEQEIGAVDITFVGSGPTKVELRAPGGSEASMKTVDDWRVVAKNRAMPPGKGTITPDAKLSTRYVLVYLTALPKVDGGFQGEIAEISVQPPR